jgi:hypothetical protein
MTLINSENETDNRAQSGAFPSAESPSRAVVAEHSIARTAATINPDLMIYFVLVRYKSGLSWAERDPANMSRRDTIADIMTGDLANVVTILECNPVEHVCSDVTEDILAAAGVFVTDDPPANKIEWLNDHRRDQRKVPA